MNSDKQKELFKELWTIHDFSKKESLRRHLLDIITRYEKCI